MSADQVDVSRRKDVQVVLSESIREPYLDRAARNEAVTVEHGVAEKLVDDLRLFLGVGDEDRAEHAVRVVLAQPEPALDPHFFFPFALLFVAAGFFLAFAVAARLSIDALTLSTGFGESFCFTVAAIAAASIFSRFACLSSSPVS